MKTVTKYLGRIIACFAELLLGVVLLIDPEGFTSAIVVVAGVAMIVVGLWYIIKYFRTEPDIAMRAHDLSAGLFLCAAGFLCTLGTKWVLATFSLVTVLYGVAMLLLGFVKTQMTVDLLRMKRRGWIVSAVNAALTIVFSVIVFTRPFSVMRVFWRFTAISIIVIAMFDIAVLFMSALKFGGEEKTAEDGADEE